MLTSVSGHRLSGSGSGSRGVIAIETVLGLPFLFMAIWLWAEIIHLGYVSALLDYAVSESSRMVRAYPYRNYKSEFIRLLRNDSSIWHAFVDIERLTIETFYFSRVDQLGGYNKQPDGNTVRPRSEPQNGRTIAIYRVAYPYRPLFHALAFSSNPVPTLRREVIAVQEYERDGMQP